MKRIVFEFIFIATTWYIFLPPLNLTSWEFLLLPLWAFAACSNLIWLWQGNKPGQNGSCAPRQGGSCLKSRGFQNQSVRENPF